MRLPSPSSGQRSVPGSTMRRSSPPTTQVSTEAFCRRAVPAIGCARHEPRSSALWSSRAGIGASTRRRCPTCAADFRIRFRHHDAGQDAVACARIVLTAEAAGWTHHRLVARWASVPRQAATVSLDRTGSVHRPVTEVSPRVRTLWSRLWHLVTGARGWRDGFRGIRDVGGQRSSARPGRRSV